MGYYRAYFRKNGWIAARDDFEAETDDEAYAAVALVCEALDSVCDSFELWQGERVIGRPSEAQKLCGHMREIVQNLAVLREEAYIAGEWSLNPESIRLREKLIAVVARLR